MIQSLPLSQPPRSLCVLRLSAIGDVCHTLPVVRTLQHAWPRTAITWVIGRTEAALVGDIPDIEFIVHDKKGGRRGMASLRDRLRGRHFDVLLMMHASLRANLISRMIAADIRLGFDRARAREFQWLFSTHRIAARRHEHVMDGLFGFAEALGVRERVLRWDIPLSAADRDFAQALIPDGRPALLISPCSSSRLRNFRNWSADRYAAVAEHALGRGLQVLLTGSNTEIEQQYGRDISALTRGPVTSLIGKTSLKQLLALLARATAIVTPDSGPAHMATAVGTPVIGLYASSNPGRTGPYDRHWTVNKYPEALRDDCGLSVEEARWGQRVRDPRAMELIMVDDVTAMLDRVLAETAAR
ncbi:MAG TPA: glycosyltransferase family 9 protein [Nevskiales bacterium]|nr:glycosyltransferase family 9 protein [Nevskiales bacterium]